MSRLFYHVMQDNAGNLLFDVSGTMRIAGSGTAATIYGDEALTVVLPNPMTNHPSFGSFKCFLGAGDYDFYMAKSGYTFETLTGVQGHGTMAQQDAANVAITGGSATGLTLLDGQQGSFNLVGIGAPVNVAYNLLVAGPTYLDGPITAAQAVSCLAMLGVQRQAVSNIGIYLDFLKNTQQGIAIHPKDSDAGPGASLLFVNLAGSQVGSVTTTASATAYNTSSDTRLKHAIAPLTGALDVVRRLRPVSFLWNADGSPGRGFLASEVQQVAPEAVSGAPDAVDADGQIVPQGLDMSKLVPWLTAALQETLAQVQALTARVATLEDGLGV